MSETGGRSPLEIAPGVYRAEGPTPNGGVYSIAYFSDSEGRPVRKEVACKVEIHEMDEAGESFFRTYGTLNEGEGRGE